MHTAACGMSIFCPLWKASNKNRRSDPTVKKTYTQSTEEVLSELQVGLEGLSSAEAQQRLQKYGPNKLKEGEKPTLLQRFLAQLKDPMLAILVIPIVEVVKFFQRKLGK